MRPSLAPAETAAEQVRRLGHEVGDVMDVVVTHLDLEVRRLAHRLSGHALRAPYSPVGSAIGVTSLHTANGNSSRSVSAAASGGRGTS